MSPLIDLIGSAKGYGWGALLASGSFESIATLNANGSNTTFEFSSIPSTYKHLQIRFSHRGIAANVYNTWFSMWLNGVSTGGQYSQHDLISNSSTVSASYSLNINNIQAFSNPGSDAPTSNDYGATIIDFPNYSNTNTFKTMRILNGTAIATSTTRLTMGLSSANYRSTSAISSITFFCNQGAFTNGTKICLYGIKG